jgi:diguanylate cyclase (GGDEF)-like protein
MNKETAPAVASQNLLRAPDLLSSCLNYLGVGLEIWDDKDRLILYNDRNNQLRTSVFIPDDLGKAHGVLKVVTKLRKTLQNDAPFKKATNGRLRTARRSHHEPPVQELPGDRWTMNFESLTPEGFLMVVRVNVTELIRQGRLLEVQNRQLTMLSTTDGVTGLANRRCIDKALLAEWQRATRSNTNLCVLMIDIDHFKKYNDHYGHLAGDACLRAVADVLRECTRRSGEVAARYGGEEFLLLLPSADLNRACETAEKCLSSLDRKAIPHAASPTSPLLTCSIGVASLKGNFSKNVETIINAADEALYRAKANGRARYAVATKDEWKMEVTSAHPV